MAETKKGGVVKKVLISLGVFLLVFVALVFYAVTWRGSTEDIEAVANSFTPQDGWVEENYSVTPPMLVCLTGRCPELSRSWTSDREINTASIESFIGDIKAIKKEGGECLNHTNSGMLGSFECSGSKNGYSFVIYISRYHKDDPIKVQLFVRKV